MLFERYMIGDLGQIASSFFLAMTIIIGIHSPSFNWYPVIARCNRSNLFK